MKKFMMFISLFCISCYHQKIIESLQYDIPSDRALQSINNEIQLFKTKKFDAFLIMEKNDAGYKITIVPSSDLKGESIQNLKIRNTNRFIKIDGKDYYLVFDYDYKFGAKFEKDIGEDGEVDIIKRHTGYIYHYATTLYFDKDWNLTNRTGVFKEGKVKKTITMGL